MKKSYLVSLLLFTFALFSLNCVESITDVDDYVIITEKIWRARGIGANAPFIEYTEYYEDGEFSHIILNRVADSNNSYKVYKECSDEYSYSSFAPYTDIYNCVHQYAFKDKRCWIVDIKDIGFSWVNDSGKTILVTSVEFGPCECKCKEGEHYLFNFITYELSPSGGVVCYPTLANEHIVLEEKKYLKE